MRILALVSLVCLLLSILGALAQYEQCGSQAGGAVCPGGLCCSEWGYCGTTPAHCEAGCQSNCEATNTAPPPPSGPTTPAPPLAPSPPSGGGAGDISSLISKDMFEKMLKHRNNVDCEGGFYTYEAFVTAAKAFAGFGTTGDDDTKKREIVAFLAQTSHETTGGWAAAPDGPYSWGYCFVTERNEADYCAHSVQHPCAPGKQYFGRGPIQLSWNYNYGPAGIALGSDLLGNPDLVAKDPILSFKAALWFWMTPQYNKPSCHDVITDKWTPSTADLQAGRVPGYGVITNIINGGIECGRGTVHQQESRIGFLMHFSDMMGVDYGTNLDCNNQRPFNA